MFAIDQERRRALCWGVLHGGELEKMIAMRSLVDLYKSAGLATFAGLLERTGLLGVSVHAAQILKGWDL